MVGSCNVRSVLIRRSTRRGKKFIQDSLFTFVFLFFCCLVMIINRIWIILLTKTTQIHRHNLERRPTTGGNGAKKDISWKSLELEVIISINEIKNTYIQINVYNFNVSAVEPKLFSVSSYLKLRPIHYWEKQGETEWLLVIFFFRNVQILVKRAWSFNNQHSTNYTRLYRHVRFMTLTLYWSEQRYTRVSI